MNVFNELGNGFLEPVYQEALAIEFRLLDIPFEREKHLPITYHGKVLKCDYFADFVVDGKVIVELKATNEILPIHRAQILSYMRLSHINTGLIINFHVSLLKDGIERFTNKAQPS